MSTPKENIEVYAHIGACLVTRLGAEGKKVRVLYGGLIKPSNAGTMLAPWQGWPPQWTELSPTSKRRSLTHAPAAEPQRRVGR